jgi:hypothetical protein
MYMMRLLMTLSWLVLASEFRRLCSLASLQSKTTAIEQQLYDPVRINH